MVADTRGEYSELFGVYVPVALAVFAIVLIALVAVVLRFRSDSRELPRGRHSNLPVELSYVVVIALIVVGLLALTYDSMSDLSAAEREDAELTVEVTAAKWNWRFDYPAYGVSRRSPGPAPATLVVPVDTSVRFRLRSVDVIHAFWVPELRFKRDAIPGRTTTFTLRFPDEGFQPRAGECAQFCGLDHASMDFDVNVLGEDEFRRWAARGRAEQG